MKGWGNTPDYSDDPDYDEDDGDSDYSEEGEDSPKFQSEINAYERVGMPGAINIGTTIAGGKLNELQRKLNKMTQEPEERFAIQIDAISRNISELQGVDISQDDIIHMLANAKDIPYVSHKNPTAYILGYLASRGGREMKKSIVHSVIAKVLPHVSDNSVHAEDVVRYARFWMQK